VIVIYSNAEKHYYLLFHIMLTTGSEVQLILLLENLRRIDWLIHDNLAEIVVNVVEA